MKTRIRREIINKRDKDYEKLEYYGSRQTKVTRIVKNQDTKGTDKQVTRIMRNQDTKGKDKQK